MNFTHRVAIAEQNNEEKMELRRIIRVSALNVSAHLL
jgi:hypothetical protein